MRATGELGGKFFAPMSMLTLVFGLIMYWFWIGFSQLWILIGLAGYAMTFCVGMFVFRPTSGRMADGRQGWRDACRTCRGQRILRAARFDYAVMLVIITDMVLKPTRTTSPSWPAWCWSCRGRHAGLGRPRRLVPSAA